jgi:hypothetical protein
MIAALHSRCSAAQPHNMLFSRLQSTAGCRHGTAGCRHGTAGCRHGQADSSKLQMELMFNDAVQGLGNAATCSTDNNTQHQQWQLPLPLASAMCQANENKGYRFLQHT